MPGFQYAVEDLNNAGTTDIGVVLGNKGREAIRDRFNDGSAFSVGVSKEGCSLAITEIPRAESALW
jgi:dTDP-glucose pyrophosphorylase